MITEDADDLSQFHAWQSAVRLQALERMACAPARAPRSLRIVALAILLALHTALFMVWYANRYRAPAQDDSVVQVRLIEAPTAPPPPSSPRTLRRAAAVAVPVSRPAMTAALVAPQQTVAAPAPVLFNRDGSIHLPPPSAPTTLQAGLARGRELLARGHNIIHCRRSKFYNGPTPEEAGIAAGKNARMAQLIMGNPLDPLGDVGATQQVDSARELAAAKRAIEQQACDY